MIIRNVIFFKQTQIKANPKTTEKKQNTFPFLERKKTENNNGFMGLGKSSAYKFIAINIYIKKESNLRLSYLPSWETRGKTE